MGTFTPAGGGDFTVMGNLRCAMGVLTCSDGPADNTTTGLKQIVGISVTPKSCATSIWNSQFSWSVAGSAGVVTAPTVASGDDFYAVIWGV